MEAGIATLRKTRIGNNGHLYLDGTRLTSEILKAAINTAIMQRGAVPSHTIVSSGEQAVDPHNEGSGPIRAHTSIIMDIFPRSQKTGYFGDMTRTVVRGHASEALQRAYHAVRKAQKIGFRRIRPGASAYNIHNEILGHFRHEGFETGLQSGRMQGFFSRRRTWLGFGYPRGAILRTPCPQQVSKEPGGYRRARFVLLGNGRSPSGRCRRGHRHRMPQPGSLP